MGACAWMPLRRARWEACEGDVATAVKKASQSCQSTCDGSGEVVMVATSWAAVSFASAGDTWGEVMKDWMGGVKGFGALLPGVSKMVVILGDVEEGRLSGWSSLVCWYF